MRGFLGRKRGSTSEFGVNILWDKSTKELNRFHIFFHHIDNYRTNAFLWVTSTGIPATTLALGKGEVGSETTALVAADSDDEADGGNEEG
jgi:tRNA pseudouridine38-40 synthase